MTLFGTDGVRGCAGVAPMDPLTVMQVGRAFGAWLSDQKTSDAPFVLIGKDTRESGDMIASAVTTGLLEAGIDVMLLGVVPTPAVAYLARITNASGGIVISASHNPYADNGVKLFKGDGFKLSDAEEAKVESLVTETGSSTKFGRILAAPDGISAYCDFVVSAGGEKKDLGGIKLVLDCSNGAMHQAAPDVFRRLGAEIVVIGDRPDGRNINAGCGSQHTEMLEKAVVEENAAMGLAFDGDGDRLIAVDETGRRISGDQLLAIFAIHAKQQRTLDPAILVSTVMSNMGLVKALSASGIRHIAANVGDRYVLNAMQENGAFLGGEDSGHLIFLDGHTTGDGLFAATRLTGIVKETGKPLSALSTVMQTYPQKLVNVAVSRKPAIETLPEISHVISEVEAELNGEGRVLVRYSGTENLCRVMVEAPTQSQTDLCAEKIAASIRLVLGNKTH